MGISIKTIGDWSNTFDWFSMVSKLLQTNQSSLASYAEIGVAALCLATPRDTGLTSASWYYVIDDSDEGLTITWANDNYTVDGESIAIMLQYGHGTGTGGYVKGVDYINPALQPIFDQIADSVWKVVTQK